MITNMLSHGGNAIFDTTIYIVNKLIYIIAIIISFVIILGTVRNHALYVHNQCDGRDNYYIYKKDIEGYMGNQYSVSYCIDDSITNEDVTESMYEDYKVGDYYR